MASLRELRIDNCDGLSSLPSELEYCTSLQTLHLEGCNGVTSFPFYTLASIRQLNISSCHGLSGPLNVWASLMDLDILFCSNLKSIEIKGGVTTSLQKLSISLCKELSSLPALPQQCPSLQHLEISGCPKVAWIGVQSSSISLHSFSDLRTFTSLRELRIGGECEGLESWVSGLQFPLSLKKEVCHLRFKWAEDRLTTNNNEEGDVLEGLRPHLELKSLSIENFMGDKFPSWLMGMSLLLNNLKKIQLLGCDKCEGVPPFGHLPNLTELKIYRMAKLTCLGAEFYGYDLVHNVATTSKEIITLFPALKVLYISWCGDLLEWKEAPTMSTKKVVVFPCLETLTIHDCSKLRNAPSHFPFLQNLEIISCDSRTPIEEISSGLTTLTSLRINGIKELTCLPQGLLKNNNNLSSLEIINCDDLTCIASDVFGSCVSLAKLEIWNCKTLRHLADGLDTLPLLKNLSIRSCRSLELIPITHGMTSLRILVIKYCEGLSSLPSGLEYCTSFQNLNLRGCDGLSGPLSVWASLMDLSIEDCRNLTSIEIKGGVTTSLQKLRIQGCEELSSLPALPQQCPSLQELYVRSCPNVASFGVQSSSISLQSFSDLRTFTSLRELRIGGECEGLESWVSGLQFPLSLERLGIYGFPNLEILPSLDNLNSLRYLGIVNWKKLQYMPTGLQHLSRLEQLSIGGFWEELDSFPDFQVGSLMHLTGLELYGWPKLKSLPQQIQHLTSLTFLLISSFEGVETLPEWLGSLTSLASLFICHCKNLTKLPSVQAMQRLTKLHTLWIDGCHPDLKQRCSRDSGTDWPKISHIPEITIR